MATKETTREERRERYESVLRVVDHQSSETQLPWVRKPAITSNRSHANVDWSDVDAALQAAVENNDLLTWRDRERYHVYCLCREDKIRRAATVVAERERINQKLLAWLQTQLINLQNDDHD